jgi:hypothetical protein
MPPSISDSTLPNSSPVTSNTIFHNLSSHGDSHTNGSPSLTSKPANLYNYNQNNQNGSNDNHYANKYSNVALPTHTIHTLPRPTNSMYNNFSPSLRGTSPSFSKIPQHSPQILNASHNYGSYMSYSNSPSRKTPPPSISQSKTTLQDLQMLLSDILSFLPFLIYYGTIYFLTTFLSPLTFHIYDKNGNGSKIKY